MSDLNDRDELDEPLMINNLPPRIGSKDDLNEILAHAVKNDVSDIFLNSGDYIWASVFGKKLRMSRRKLQDTEVMSLLSRIYGEHAATHMAGVAVVDSSHEYKDESKNRFRFRLNATGFLQNGKRGVSLTFRTIPTDPPPLEVLGVEQEFIDALRYTDQGLILVCGATGNGKSTTLASGIRHLLEDQEGHRNIITVESPIEFVYDNVIKPSSLITQSEIGVDIKTFSQGVENALRRAPQIILVGEARDYDTISSAINASITGHTVLSTVHSNSVEETMPRLIDVYPQELQGMAKISLTDALKMILVQRLVPSTDGKRVALRSFLLFDDEVKDALRQTNDVSGTLKVLLQKKGQTMTACAKRYYEEGRISEEWYKRIQMNYT